MALTTVPCTFCGTFFQKYSGRVSHTNFCCGAHYHAYKASLKENHPQHKERTLYTCDYCHNTFERLASAKGHRKHNFCCPEHGHAWRSANERGDSHPAYTCVIIPCANCKSPLNRQNNRIEKNKYHFCDHACYSEWISKNALGENAFRWAGGNVKVSCAQCGAELERPMNAIKRSEKHFCDIYCRGDWQSENKIGEAHPLWTGGYKNYYGPNWSKQRQAARERDGHICQKCGKTKEENGKELDVHHIIPFRKFKYKAGENNNYLQANQLDNLTTLCTNCHSKTKAIKHKP